MINEIKYSNQIILIGAGGHAHSLLQMQPREIVHFWGYVAPERANDLPLKYFGDDDEFRTTDFPGYALPQIHFAMIAGKSGDMSRRRHLIKQYMGSKAATLISQSAIVTANSHIGNGCAIMERVIINGVHIGDYSVVNTGAIIEHQCHIGFNTFIGPGAVLCGEVQVGDNCYIGAGVNIAPGVHIVSDTIIGIGSTVLHDITESGTYVGSPVHRVK